jgi:hypothetical protein
MRKLVIVVLIALGLGSAPTLLRAITTNPGATIQSPDRGPGTSDRLAGTWKLVSVERRGPTGDRLPPPASPAFGSDNPTGFVIYDRAGYMAVTIMQSGRQKYAAEQPSPEEARTALASYAAYYGTFTVNDADHVVTHHLQGSLSPGLLGTDQRRSFELSGNRLTLKPPVGANGVQSALTWERVPELPNLTPIHRRFLGFWKLVSNERLTPTGERVSGNAGQTGYIIYTASGHMMVHLMQADHKRYAGAQPTPDETLNAIRTYGSYFGPFTIHERENYVVHHRLGIVNPGQVGSDAQRFYEFSGNRLKLRPPVTKIDGRDVQGLITWERVTGSAGPSQ